MQQDRLLGAAGEGRYAAIRGWAGRPEYGNSLLVKEPLAGTSVERLDSRSGRSAHRVAGRAARRRRRSLVVVTHLHHAVDARRPSATPRPRRLARLAATAPTPTPRRVGDFNADPRGAGVRADGRGRVPIGVRRGERRRAAGHVAVGPPGARRWTPTATRTASTTSGSAARSGSSMPGSSSIARTPRTPTLYPSDHLGIGAHLRDRLGRGRDDDAGPRRSGSPTAATGGAPRRTASRRSWRRVAVPGCDGLEFDVRRSRDGVPVLLHDETLERVQGRPDRVER